MQETRVPSLVWEDPICLKAANCMPQRPQAATPEAHTPRAYAPQQEKQLQWEARAPQ